MKKIYFKTGFKHVITGEETSSEKDYADNVEKLSSSLTEIMSGYGAEGVILSCSDSDPDIANSPDMVFSYIDRIRENFRNKAGFEIGRICVGTSIYEYDEEKDEYTKVGNTDRLSAGQIQDDVTEQELKGTEIVWTGFADDIEADLVGIALSHLNKPYGVFDTKKRGIVGLNAAMDEYLIKNNIQNSSDGIAQK